MYQATKKHFERLKLCWINTSFSSLAYGVASLF